MNLAVGEAANVAVAELDAGWHLYRFRVGQYTSPVGRTQVAPAQRLVDFCEGRGSSSLPVCSYPPGITAARLDELLPKEIGDRLREGLKAFGAKMRGYYTNDAVVVGVESRTSSPVRVPRDPETLEHPGVRGLFPCGEGAGYAGGIVSAAIDGERVAERIFALYPA